MDIPETDLKSPLDPVDELKLRTWAREHYSAPELRSATWHPVVLDEMQRRDDESRAGRMRPASASDLVPLNPEESIPQREEYEIPEVAQSQAPVPKPHISLTPQRVSHRELRTPSEAIAR